MKRLEAFTEKLFFFCVVSMSFLLTLSETLTDYNDGSWFGFVIGAGLCAMIAHAYITNWRHKI